MLVIQGGLAELYSDNLSQEVKKGLHERRAQWLYLGLLPFGVSKGGDGVPVPDPETHKGLLMAYEMAGQGHTDRDIAQVLNGEGFRTAGNRGNRPFTKDTVGGVLTNRFYLGELPDGNGGWIPGKHEPMIDEELFTAAQRTRQRNSRNPATLNHKARVYSLSCLMKSAKCGSKMRMQMSPKGNARAYCAGRALGLGCDCKGTFLEVYEQQIRWYLEHFVIPDDYKEKILADYRKLEEAYDDIDRRRATLQARQRRLQEMYEWGHKSREDYLTEYMPIQRELDSLRPIDGKEESLDRLALFLSNVASAWDAATPEQRNKLARTLFDEVIVEDTKVVAVRPRPELEPFFKLNLECQTVNIAGDPDRNQGRQRLDSYKNSLIYTNAVVWLRVA